jgi:molybdopterin synthase catalytic subunit
VIPPVSGGETGPRLDSEPHVRISEPRSLDVVAGAVVRPDAGAVAFEGTTREVDRLEYEAYVEMAERSIEAMLRERVDRHRLAAAAAEHRVGACRSASPA